MVLFPWSWVGPRLLILLQQQNNTFEKPVDDTSTKSIKTRSTLRRRRFSLASSPASLESILPLCLHNHHYSFSRHGCLALLLLLFLQVSKSHSFLYVNNETYPSLPALFGRFLVNDKIYDARLQYFHSNPYLCELDDKTMDHFVPPYNSNTNVRPSSSQSSPEEEEEPVALLVMRGNCPFERKAIVAESIHASVKFVFIANFNLDNVPSEEDTLVPMFSEFGTTRLVLLSVSHETGQALKKFISEQSPAVLTLGGPVIQFDSQSDAMTVEDLQSMLLSALGLFFMLMSFTGCLIILAGTYAQIVNSSEGGGDSGDGNTPVGMATHRRLLTSAEVRQLTLSTATINLESSSNATATVATSSSNRGGLRNGVNPHNNSEEDDEEMDVVQLEDATNDQCAVCLGDFDESSLTSLPCRHKFHTSCITPWLIERQSKCPLCKFDVLQHIRDNPQPLVVEINNGNENALSNSSASLWDQMRRYRWTSVRASEDVDHGAALREVEGVEMAEQRRTII